MALDPDPKPNESHLAMSEKTISSFQIEGQDVTSSDAIWLYHSSYKTIQQIRSRSRFVRYLYIFDGTTTSDAKIGVSSCPRRRADKLIKNGSKIGAAAICGPFRSEDAFSFERDLLKSFCDKGIAVTNEWISLSFQNVFSSVVKRKLPMIMQRKEVIMRGKEAAAQITHTTMSMVEIITNSLSREDQKDKIAKLIVDQARCVVDWRDDDGGISADIEPVSALDGLQELVKRFDALGWR